MNKRGMLLASETLKMILAVISLVFLAYLLFSLYYSNQDQKNFIEASALLDEVKVFFNSPDLNQYEFVSVGPGGWSLFSFVGNELKPNQCYNEGCICICDSVIDEFLWIENGQVNECSSEGACLVVETLNKFGEIEIKSGGETSLWIIKDRDFMEVREI